jgi:hypothetical protein
VEVRWPAPSARVERFARTLGVDRYVTLVEGKGEPAAATVPASTKGR